MMKNIKGIKCILLIFVYFMVIDPIIAEEKKIDYKTYDWKEKAKKFKLSKEIIKEIAENKILVTNETYKQVFEPYIGDRKIPIFVTSDAVLNAFHVLYEESIMRMEIANIKKLKGLLNIVWNNLSTVEKSLKNAEPQLAKKAKKRAQIIIGVGLKLIGNENIKIEEDISKIVDDEINKILAAKDVLKPDWLGKPDTGFTALDYSRYKPRGFYTKTERLQKYFRALSWLQSIPFRVTKDEEFLSILMLGNSIESSRIDDDVIDSIDLHYFFKVYKHFIGKKDGWDIEKAEQVNFDEIDVSELESMREELIEDSIELERYEMINDQIGLKNERPSIEDRIVFRILSPYRTPDAILFQKTTGQNRQLPSGLDICAVLGSSFAREELVKKNGNSIINKIEEAQKSFEGYSLYFKYLECLKELVNKPEEDAPSFMSSDIWERKSCQTVLSGWAQLRYTWALQAKQSVTYLCASFDPVGFVEPEPEFFSKMARLTQQTKSILNYTGAFEEDLDSLISDIKKAIKLMENIKTNEDMKKLTNDERSFFSSMYELGYFAKSYFKEEIDDNKSLMKKY
ncbi:MAG: DUF3160 domain-containing protein [Candidatus Aureabacteria bacterium]|nr:DUF3160 domain-containing protein [Candidatus Auribacterota bacterium]